MCDWALTKKTRPYAPRESALRTVKSWIDGPAALRISSPRGASLGARPSCRAHRPARHEELRRDLQNLQAER